MTRHQFVRFGKRPPLIDQDVATVVGSLNQRGFLAGLDQFELNTGGLHHGVQNITQRR